MRDDSRSRWRALGTAVLGASLLGMGALGGGRDPGIPARDFRAVLTDLDGTRIDVNRLTVGGDTSLDGELGRGRLRIPFDQIKQITLAGDARDRDRVQADVALRDAQPVRLVLRSSTTFYGQTGSGAFSIRARDLRAVDLEP